MLPLKRKNISFYTKIGECLKSGDGIYFEALHWSIHFILGWGWGSPDPCKIYFIIYLTFVILSISWWKIYVLLEITTFWYLIFNIWQILHKQGKLQHGLYRRQRRVGPLLWNQRNIDKKQSYVKRLLIWSYIFLSQDYHS